VELPRIWMASTLSPDRGLFRVVAEMGFEGWVCGDGA